MQSEIEQISTHLQMALIHKHKKVQLQIKYLLQNKIS